MRRVARWGRIRAGAVEEYTRLHREMSAELLAVHAKAGLRHFSIYRRGRDLFSYVEVDDWDAALACLAEEPRAREWAERMKTLLDDPLPWPELKEVWHLD